MNPSLRVKDYTVSDKELAEINQLPINIKMFDSGIYLSPPFFVKDMKGDSYEVVLWEYFEKDKINNLSKFGTFHSVKPVTKAPNINWRYL